MMKEMSDVVSNKYLLSVLTSYQYLVVGIKGEKLETMYQVCEY